jgi:hypothetical protein
VNGVPAEDQLITCPACGKLFFFARTPAGAAMPLDAKPIKQGYSVPDLKEGETDHTCAPAGFPVFTTHWGTCSDPDRFRREHKSYKKAPAGDGG